MISVERKGKIAIVRFTESVTNPINLEFIKKLYLELEKLERDPNVGGIVLTSGNDKFFSIGFDIPELISQNEAEFTVFYRNINNTCLKLYTIPKPTIAAVSGHAVAGGCVIALCCDFRFISDGRAKMGLNEIKLGVPVPYPVDCILRDLTGTRIARDIMETGDFFDPRTSHELGIVDKIVPADELINASVEKINNIAEMPSEAFAMIKRNRTEPVLKTIMENLEDRQKLFIKMWFSDTARNNLKKAMENF